MTGPVVRTTIVAILLTLTACSGGGDGDDGLVDPSPTAVDTVRMTATSFEPANLTIRRGATVVWINTQPILHTVTPEGHTQWTSRASSSPGEVLRVTFNDAGAFPYYCEPHRGAGMTGRITVQQ